MKSMYYLVFVLTVVQCQKGNIVEVAKKLGATTLLELVQDAGLTDTLSSGGPFTVFAPTNEAFSKLPPDVASKLKSDKQLLTDVLKAHVIENTTISKQFTDDDVLNSLNSGATIRINIYKSNLFVRPIPPPVITANGCNITLRDQKASNGVIHVISKVMYPFPLKDNIIEVLQNTSSMSTLLKAIIATKIDDIIADVGPFTLFAPTNEAFDNLPPGTLDNLLKNETAITRYVTYHLIGGSKYFVGIRPTLYYSNITHHAYYRSSFLYSIEGGSLVIALNSTTDLSDIVINHSARFLSTDLSVGNGVIHTIDTVLAPPRFP